MKTKTFQTLVRESISRKDMERYLTASWGALFGVYLTKEGSVCFLVGGEVGSEISHEERPIAVAKCPGIENLDAEFFGFYDDAAEFKSAVIEACRYGDISHSDLDMI